MKIIFILPLVLSVSTVSAQPKLNRKLNKNEQQGHRKLTLDGKLRGGASVPSILSSLDNDVDSKNLTAVIHIGPMKTGSSAIQLSLGKVYSTLRDVDLYEDAGFSMDDGIEAYHMVGCFRPDAVPFTGKPDFFEISCHPHALDQVSKVAERSHNLMITAEYLTDPQTDLDKLKEFLKPWKNHRVVAYYRRYYDWLLSFHNQIYKQHETPITRKSVPDFLENEMKHHFFYETMYLTKAIERYQAKGFNDVKVINLYDLPNHDVREPFYCAGLVNATATCNKFREFLKTEKPAVENPSVSLVYNELAYYAKDMNLWNEDHETTLDVKSISKAAQEYHNRRRQLRNTMDLPAFYGSGAYICPTPEVYRWLLETSLAIEKEVFPEYYEARGKTEIMQHFDSLVKAKKFCHVDAKHILENDSKWRNFFQQVSTE